MPHVPCFIFILLLSSLTIALSSSNQPLWPCHYPCCNDEIIACCFKLAIRIVLSADGPVCYPKVPGDVFTDCKSICSFSGSAQISSLNGISAQPSGAELQAGWVSMWISKSVGPFPPSILHKKSPPECVYWVFWGARSSSGDSLSLDSSTALGKTTFSLCASV